MNKFITMLILGVVAAAMLLVLGMHMGQLPDEEAPAPIVAGQPATTGQATESGATALPAGALSDSQSGAAEISTSLRTPVRQPDEAAPAQPEGGAGPSAASSASPSASQSGAASAASGQPAVIPVQSGSGAAATPPPAVPARQPSASSGSASAPARQAPATASVSRGKGSIVEMSLQFRGRGMALVIVGDGPLPVRHFVLTGPDRLVVDLPGAWRNLKAPAVPGNNLVKSIRIGRQGDADRVVLDLKTTLKSHGINRISDKKVEVLFN